MSADDDDRVVRLEVVRDVYEDRSTYSSPPPEDVPPQAEPTLPPDCPVTPIGCNGRMYYYLNRRREFVELRDTDHQRLVLMGLVGQDTAWLERTYPRKNADGIVTGWRPEKFAEALMASASALGIWSPQERVRGRGGWRSEDGELILHLGNGLLTVPRDGIDGEPIDNAYHRATRSTPGLVHGMVYPAGDPLPAPSALPATPEAADELLTLLASWQWRRGRLDARLLLGWIACAMLGAALRWRPACWITGNKSTGKSTLSDEILAPVLGPRLLQSANTSAAGVYQTLGAACLPVAIDELEPDDDPRHVDALLKLARLSGSGGTLRRGGSDHTQHEFTARSSFLFSSILMPPLQPQDYSRFAVLELEDFPRGAVKPDISPGRLRLAGTRILRRLVDGWPTFERRLEVFRRALVGVGHIARGCDVYGHLLAGADVILHDTPPDPDSVAELVEPLHAGRLAIGSVGDDAEEMLQHLMTSQIDPYRSGARDSVATWVYRAAGLEHGYTAEEGNKALASYGLRVMEHEGGKCLAIAGDHAGLGQLFERTHWASKSGRTRTWVQNTTRLTRLHDGHANVQVRIGRRSVKAALLPLDVAIELHGDGEG